jgi:transcriptional regulator of acetoin/glycerol metabolism
MKTQWILEIESKNDVPTMAEVELAHIAKVHALADGNAAKTARLLDIGRTTLYRKMKVRPWDQRNQARKKNFPKSSAA